ncbi:MAG: hypothetical protein N5P05_002231 [Chroococcopsis gigantea SAG 12.99]|jgi:hypothetical protein|nr:hypothetical protein [Chroococcopsis gigantea SAG 12.99]
MTEIVPETNTKQIAAILNNYGFEMRGYTSQELMERWQRDYPLRWIEMAVVEALYQGRYKVISIEEILKIWFRRGQPTFHFTYEFERLVCQKSDLFPCLESTSSPDDEVREKSSLLDNPKQGMTDIEQLFAQIPLTVPDSHPRNQTPAEKKSISQFTPLLDGSLLYTKLKAIARQS